MPEIDWKAYNQRVELQRQMMEEEAKKNAWKNRVRYIEDATTHC